MSWSKGFGFGAAILNKKEAAPKLPLQARIGSRVAIQASAFISADISGSLLNSGDDFGLSVVSMSSVLFDGMNQKAYRYYTSNGDNDTKETFIEFLSGEDNLVPAELMVCTKIQRQYPTDPEEQAMYMGKRSPDGLGSRFYALGRDTLLELGFSEEKLAQVLGDRDELEYERDIDNSLEFVRPLHGYETRIDNDTGSEGMRQELYYMPYVRDLQNGGKEFLIISTEVVKSLNGNESDCLEIHVDFVIGILVPKDKIEIQ